MLPFEFEAGDFFHFRKILCIHLEMAVLVGLKGCAKVGVFLIIIILILIKRENYNTKNNYYIQNKIILNTKKKSLAYY